MTVGGGQGGGEGGYLSQTLAKREILIRGRRYIM